jgi:hypothetical protein
LTIVDDHSRVILSGDEKSDYINASYINVSTYTNGTACGVFVTCKFCIFEISDLILPGILCNFSGADWKVLHRHTRYQVEHLELGSSIRSLIILITHVFLGRKPKTVNDFWRMIFEHKCPTIACHAIVDNIEGNGKGCTLWRFTLVLLVRTNWLLCKSSVDDHVLSSKIFSFRLHV